MSFSTKRPQHSTGRRDYQASNVPRSPRPTSMSPRNNRQRRPYFGGTLEIHTVEKTYAEDEQIASKASLQSPRQHPPKSPRSKPYRARGSRGRGGRRRKVAAQNKAVMGAASPRSVTSEADTDAEAYPDNASADLPSDVSQETANNSAVATSGMPLQQQLHQQQQQQQQSLEAPPQVVRTMDAARAWASTIDRPMESIEIFTQQFANGLCPVNATEETSVAVPNLQRIRSLSSELSISTLDSPRRYAAMSVGRSECLVDSIIEEDTISNAPMSIGGKQMTHLADDLKGLALIDEDIPRTATNITSASTFTATGSGSVASSQVHVRQVPSADDIRPSASDEYSANSTQAYLSGLPGPGGVLPPPMMHPHQNIGHYQHMGHYQQSYESSFLAGRGRDGRGDSYSCSEEESSSLFHGMAGDSNNSQGYAVPNQDQGSMRGREYSAAPNPSVYFMARGDNFIDPAEYNHAMGFSQAAPIPFPAEQIDQATKAALDGQNWQLMYQGGNIETCYSSHPNYSRRPNEQNTLHFQNWHGNLTHEQNNQPLDQAIGPYADGRGRTFSDTSLGRGKCIGPHSSIAASRSHDDSVSLFNTSPKSFLLGSTPKSSFDCDGS